MSTLDGQILFALIAALLLAWLASVWVARRYASTMLEFMQSNPAPSDTLTAEVADISTSLITQPIQSIEVDLQQQNRRARLRLHAGLLLLSLIFAAIIAAVALAAAVDDDDGFSLRRLSILTLVYCWPCVPSIGLLEHWSRWKIFSISLGYVLFAGVVVMLNSTENQAFLRVLLWLFSGQLPLLLVVFVITGPRLRSTGPYLIFVFFILCASSLMGLSALEHSLKLNGSASWIIDIAQHTNAYLVFALFSIVPWLIAFFPVRHLAQRLARAYHEKAFSETLYLTAGLWTIALLMQALTLSHSMGLAAYTQMTALLLLPPFMLIMRRALRPRHAPPTLLLLRVFRSDDSIESLFDQVIERWRYSGNTLMIAGNDLALRNLEPDELFGFLSGRLQERFIDSSMRLQHALTHLDFSADPDGRFRINECFCFDSTWKMVLETLVNKADRVLMDLRGYTPDRQGCSYELSVLASKPHIKKLIILFNKATDKSGAEWLLADRRLKIEWIDSEQQAQKTADRILGRLLS